MTPPVCLEIAFDANVGSLRKEIATSIGIPEDRQRIVWIRQMDEFNNGIEIFYVLKGCCVVVLTLSFL